MAKDLLSKQNLQRSAGRWTQKKFVIDAKVILLEHDFFTALQVRQLKIALTCRASSVAQDLESVLMLNFKYLNMFCRLLTIKIYI